MPNFFRLHGRCTGALSVFHCFLLFPFLLISCRRDNLYPNDGTVSLGTPFYASLPKGYISLTYDDGPGPGTADLAKWLRSEKICATFFVVGNSDPGGGYMHYPVLDSLVYYGQRIGNHTLNHRDLKTLACEDRIYQIKQNQLAIDPLIHNNLCYFTPPWFSWTWPISECILTDPELKHMRGPIGMTFDSEDYLYRDYNTASECANKFVHDSANLANINKGKGGVVKMHDFNSYVDKDFALEETKMIVHLLRSRGYVFVSPTLEFSPLKISIAQPGEFSGDQKWAAGYFKSIRLADVNGDGMADIIGRNADGVHVALSTGLGFANEEVWSDEFSDMKGWGAAEYHSTIRWADVNGDRKADLIIRGPEGISVALSTGNGFEQSTLWTNYFSDDSSRPWKKVVGYSGTLCAGDVNGDGLADIVVRGPEGIYVSLSSSSSFIKPALWTSEFSDQATIAWKEAKYSSTFQLADVNGDGRADLIVRGPRGIMVSLSTGNGFQQASLWSTLFSDGHGWGKDESFYGAIRLGDVNGDEMADLIVRAKDGVHVLLSNGHGFLEDMLWYHSNYADHYQNNTLQVADINGDHRSDFILRSKDGIDGAVAP
ncbi:MAG TPA: FG-GAP-like repeat-containing protein [Puia sp.]|nr:FG-GAP-like repeat-containing protein [Puia sp.]